MREVINWIAWISTLIHFIMANFLASAYLVKGFSLAENEMNYFFTNDKPIKGMLYLMSMSLTCVIIAKLTE